MSEYVFKEEFLEENRPRVVENSAAPKRKNKSHFEGAVKLVFVQSSVCLILVLVALIFSLLAPKAYNGFKNLYVSATTQNDVEFEDVKKLLSKIHNFIFATNKDTEKIGSGGADTGKNVSLNAYALTSKIAAPTKGTVTSLFGPRIHPIFKTEGFHTGLDIANKAGTNITAAFSGTVYECGTSKAYGNYIIMRHSPSLYTFYGHCESLKAKEGMNIRKGEVIAFMGSTGYSTGPHLHFEIRIDGKSVNPAYALKGNPYIEF